MGPIRGCNGGPTNIRKGVPTLVTKGAFRKALKDLGQVGGKGCVLKLWLYTIKPAKFDPIKNEMLHNERIEWILDNALEMKGKDLPYKEEIMAVIIRLANVKEKNIPLAQRLIDVTGIVSNLASIGGGINAKNVLFDNFLDIVGAFQERLSDENFREYSTTTGTIGSEKAENAAASDKYEPVKNEFFKLLLMGGEKDAAGYMGKESEKISTVITDLLDKMGGSSDTGEQEKMLIKLSRALGEVHSDRANSFASNPVFYYLRGRVEYMLKKLLQSEKRYSPDFGMDKLISESFERAVADMDVIAARSKFSHSMAGEIYYWYGLIKKNQGNLGGAKTCFEKVLNCTKQDDPFRELSIKELD